MKLACLLDKMATIAQAAEVSESGKKIDVRSENGDIAASSQLSSRPGNEAWDPVPSLVRRALLAAHTGIEYLNSVIAAIIGGINEDRILGQSVRVEELF